MREWLAEFLAALEWSGRLRVRVALVYLVPTVVLLAGAYFASQIEISGPFKPFTVPLRQDVMFTSIAAALGAAFKFWRLAAKEFARIRKHW